MKALKPQHQKFAETYALGKCSAADAAKEAGYSPKSAKRIAVKLLKNKSIAAEVARIRKESSERTAITMDWITEQLVDNSRAARADADYSASNKALELLGKQLGMFRENVNLSGKAELTIQVVRFGDDSNSA
jgi:phage terminase small subunit